MFPLRSQIVQVGAQVALSVLGVGEAGANSS